MRKSAVIQSNTGPASNRSIAAYEETPAEQGKALSDDPWKGRSAEMKCRICMYSCFKKTDNKPADERGKIGRCRRHAPTMAGFPVIFETDWRGDHKIDEDKL